jgi:ferredoxin-NADP reductase
VDPGISDKYLLISIGSGVTPIVSLYKHLAKSKPSAQIVNIYGERHAQDILPSIQELFIDNASMHNILYLSQEESLPAQRKK